jgi:hypothetical protein
MHTMRQHALKGKCLHKRVRVTSRNPARPCNACSYTIRRSRRPVKRKLHGLAQYKEVSSCAFFRESAFSVDIRHG